MRTSEFKLSFSFKKHLKFLEGELFLRGGPPKISTFSGQDSEHLLIKRDSILGPLEE